MPFEGRLLHPTSLLFNLLWQAKSFIVPGLFAVFIARQRGFGIALLLLFVPAAIWVLIRHFTWRYGFDGDEIVIHEGLVFRRQRHIPYARVQNLDLERNPLHRLLGVAEMRLETAGGNEPEATFRVLSLAAVEEMRQRIFAYRQTRLASTADAAVEEPVEAVAGVLAETRPELRDQDPDDQDPDDQDPHDQELLRLPIAELLKLSLADWRGAALLAAAVGVLWEMDIFDRIGFWNFVWGFLQIDPRQLAREGLDAVGFSLFGSLITVLITVVSIVSLMLVAGGVWTLIRFYDFRLQRRGNDLRIRCGLLTRHEATVPRHRIQQITVHEGLIFRALGRAALRIETAGSGGDDKDAISRKHFVPIIDRDAVEPLLESLVPDLRPSRVEWLPLARAAPRRMRRAALRLSLLSVILPVSAISIGGWLHALWSLPVAAAIPFFCLWVARRQARITRYSLGLHGFFFRSGALGHNTSFVPFEKVQVIQTRCSPFDRRWGMASLILDTAGSGATGHRIEVPYLEAPVATDLLRQLGHRTAGREFRW